MGVVRSGRVPRGDGGGALRRRRVVAEADLRRHRVGGVGRASSRVPAVGFGANAFERRDDGPIVRLRVPERGRAVARVDPTHDRDARAFATAANDAPRSETGDEKDDRSSSAKRVCETSKRARIDSTRVRTDARRGDGEAPSIEETPKLDRDTRMDRHEPRPARPVHRAPGVPSAGAARGARGAARQRRTRRGFLARRGEVARARPAQRSLRTKRSLGILLLA